MEIFVHRYINIYLIFKQILAIFQYSKYSKYSNIQAIFHTSNVKCINLLVNTSSPISFTSEIKGSQPLS